jgi:hypothetical protein
MLAELIQDPSGQMSSAGSGGSIPVRRGSPGQVRKTGLRNRVNRLLSVGRRWFVPRRFVEAWPIR